MIIYTWVDRCDNIRWSARRPRNQFAQVGVLGGVYRNGHSGHVWGMPPGRSPSSGLEPMAWGDVGECLQLVYGGAK